MTREYSRQEMGNSAETKVGASNDAGWIHGRLIYPLNAHYI